MISSYLFIILLLFNLLNNQLIALPSGNGTVNKYEFSTLKQCYGSMGNLASGSYRIQFRVVGTGHCQLLLCYPSQLDPNALPDGMEPEIGYHLKNLETNTWMENCPSNQSKNWHGIYVDVDVDTINLTLSFYDQSFSIDQNDFIIELGNPSHSSLTTKLSIFNFASQQYEIKEFENDEQIHQKFLGIQNKGALLADFAGFWALALDMLPSNLNQNKIKIFTLMSRDKKHEGHDYDICDIESGNLIEDNCSIQAWFLEPSDNIIPYDFDENNTSSNSSNRGIINLPFTGSLMEKPLKIGDKIHITGRLNATTDGYFRIHLLHNWTEPDSIMGETVLTILMRRNYINFESKYNFTEHKPSTNETILDKIKQNLYKNIDQKFSMDIGIDENGNYMVTLNCKNESAFIFTQAIDNPLKFTSINYILIEADNGWELHRFQIKRLDSPFLNSSNVSAPISDPSFSIKLDYRDEKRKNLIYVKLKLPQNASKFDINLILHYGEQNRGKILLHFHANLNENFYQLGKCYGNQCPNWKFMYKFINVSYLSEPLSNSHQVVWIFKQILEFNSFISWRFEKFVNKSLILIDDQKIELVVRIKPNYIQFKGDLVLSEVHAGYSSPSQIVLPGNDYFEKGSILILYGKIPKNAKVFTIDLIDYDGEIPKINECQTNLIVVCEIPLHIHCNLAKDIAEFGQLKIDTNMDGERVKEWSNKLALDPNPFRVGMEFEMNITSHPKEFNIVVQELNVNKFYYYSYNSTYFHIKTIEIHGDILMLDQPILKHEHDYA